MIELAKVLVYELYPLAWSWGLKEMTVHLERIAALGCVDYVWLAPVYLSPWNDHGYDIADYYNVDPRLGALNDLDCFIKRAHELGLKVLMDLVLNHTSTKHSWFRTHPEYYCWDTRGATKYPNWHNLFDNGSTWAWDKRQESFYCHLFHPKQADLNWFVDGDINMELVKEFRDIVSYWLRRGIDGFRLDVPQSINKDFQRESLELSDLILGNKACEVINAVFASDGASVTWDEKKPFLMVELLDPTYGDAIKFYTEQTPVDFCLNILVKDLADSSSTEFKKQLKKSCDEPSFMLDLESHDSPRFLSRRLQQEMAIPTSVILLVEYNPQGICLYQGQELGLKNPTLKELPGKLMLELDAQTKMRYKNGETLSALRATSRANARVPIPLEKYKLYEQYWQSPLGLSARLLRDWKNS